MAKKGTVTAVVNQKGGSGKTTSCENPRIVLTKEVLQNAEKRRKRQLEQLR